MVFVQGAPGFSFNYPYCVSHVTTYDNTSLKLGLEQMIKGRKKTKHFLVLIAYEDLGDVDARAGGTG